MEDVRAFEVALGGHAVPLHGQVGPVPEGVPDGFRAPDVEDALLALGVGVLGGVETAVGVAQVPQDVGDDLGEHLTEAGLAGHLPGVEVEPGEEGLVIEHLLEVGDHPEGVDRVAGEPAAEVVVHAAGGHGVEGGDHGIEQRRVRRAGVGGQEELVAHRLGELGGATEAAPLLVVLGPEVPAGRGHDVGPGDGRGLQAPAAGHGLGQALGLGGGVVTVLAPVLVDRHAHLLERGQAVAALLREVGAAVEGLAVGGHEDGERPAPVAGHGLHGVHVDPVDVGALLPIHLHVDEEAVQQLGGGRVLEGLVGHDVAPVTGRVADGDQEGPVLVAGLGEGLLAPRIPVDRVLGVLAEIGARLVGEAVGHPRHGNDRRRRVSRRRGARAARRPGRSSRCAGRRS